MRPPGRGDGGDLEGRRVRVELADGYNFAGTVRRDRGDGVERRLLVEDSQGNERVVRLARPCVSVAVGGNQRRRQDILREAHRDERQGGDSA